MMPPAKIFVCFTWPAMTACVTPASFIRLMHLPSWPSEIQWIAGAPALPRRRQIGRRFLLGSDDRDVVTHGSGGVQDKKRKPAISCDQA